MNSTWTEIFDKEKNKKQMLTYEKTYVNVLFAIFYELFLAAINSIIICMCLGAFAHVMMSFLFEKKYKLKTDFIDILLAISLIYHIAARIKGVFIYKSNTFSMTLFRFIFDLFSTSLFMIVCVSLLQEMATHLIAEKIMTLSFVWSIGMRWVYEIVFKY